MSRVLITGANGWIAGSLAQVLVARGDEVWGLTRRAGSVPERVHEWLHEGADFAGLERAWPDERTFDVMIHLAGRVHAHGDSSDENEAAYQETNSLATARLAELARAHGVGRFVFLSSAKALGEKDPGHPWREDEKAEPRDAYGRSKHAAELQLAQMQGIEIVIVRPPLVYGPGVRANFARLMKAVARGWPLPLGAAQAQRSLVYIDNLVDALTVCAHDPRAAGRLFHVADAELFSVRDLVILIGSLLGRPARLVAVPVPWLQALGQLVGRGPEIARLTDALRLDTHLIQKSLDWSPPVSAADGLERTVAWYRTTC